jgi:hypothetical protein
LNLPFTPEQFFGVFAEYNRTFWFVVPVLWLTTACTLVLAWRRPVDGSPMLAYTLGALWLWTAVAYHGWLFTRINPAAWLFGALFAVQAILFLRLGLQRSLQYFSRPGPIQALGIALVCYALSYPLLSLSLGHSYPATPTFGVPCPTAILTIGLLLTARGGAPWVVSIIPALWGLVGGSAAVLLAVWIDYVLLGAGALLTLVLITQQIRPE